jgi:hypothetical protein
LLIVVLSILLKYKLYFEAASATIVAGPPAFETTTVPSFDGIGWYANAMA